MSLPLALPADLTQDDVWRPHAARPAATNAVANSEGANPWGEDGFTFADLIDIVNPLQHIPVVSTLYRRLTGDDIAPAAQFAGGALLGGVPGLMVAGANVALDEATGRDIGETVLAALSGENLQTSAPPTALAANEHQPPAKLAMAAQASVGETPPAAAVTANQTFPAAVAANQTFLASAAPASFFAAQPSTPALAVARQPGAIQNTLFRPNATVKAAAIEAYKPGAKPAAPDPVDAAATPALTAPAAAANTATEADTKRLAANRAALLSLAKDLRTTIEGHEAYNTNQRLKTLYQAHDAGGLRAKQ